MHCLIQFAKADGRLLALWQASPDTLLDAQVRAGTDEHGYALTDSALSAETLLADYGWHEGALRAKDVLTLTAEPAPFAADGVTECHVSVSPFQPCTLLCNGQSLALTEDDPVLTLTTDTPQTFWISVAPMGRAKADPLMVEAT